MEHLSYIFGAAGLTFTAVTIGYNVLRNRRLDTRTDGDRETSVIERLARMDERLKRLEADVDQCVMADMLTLHLTALEARIGKQIEEAADRVRGERRRDP